MEDKEKKDKILLEQEIYEFIEETLKLLKKFSGKSPNDLSELKKILQITLENINAEIQVLKLKGISIEIKKSDLRLYTEDEYGFDC